MPDSPSPHRSDEQDASVQIDQGVKGDRNQTIGQVLGGMVVYVSGGQAIINTGPDASIAATEATNQSELGPNPYKGLLAFQETDGDRFFGRDTQIKQLRQQFRELHDADGAIRLLPIYGPSGSGKSSLARAGLIPELAQRPLSGRDRARVAVLVPGTHPLEALATVLARVATNDPTPVAKVREFRAELSQANADGPTEGQYDGLRRIADVLPDIAISPLIVVVDQLEEIYTLCEDEAERTAFVQGLLCAASDRAKRVSVIVTMRSDFLSETQKYPGLNRLFSTQGFLAPVMNDSELREAICKPAVLAGHPLDEGTVGRLIDQTESREGALPLLQFALSQIWEGLEKGLSPAVTLEKIGGVGGALAGEAERVYAGLSSEQQTIARRLFLGLVQLGEGTRDTRRRVAVESLVAQKENPAAVKQVLEKFTDLSVRLITCAATDKGTETAEVTHEALFDHWQLLQQWLEESRSDLRFQRRLEVAVVDWDEMGRPEGKLWRSPDLDVLRQYAERVKSEMTPLNMAFFTASEQAVEKAERERHQQRGLLIGVLLAGLTLTTGAAVFATYQMQRFERQRVNQLATTAETLLLSERPVDASIHAIAATGASKSVFVQFLRPSSFNSAYASLLNSRRANAERNQLKGHEDVINSVAFSPDGKTLVSGSSDNTVRLWNAMSGEPIGEPLKGHEDVVNSVAFSPDGKTLVSGSSDNTVRLWDAMSGEPIGEPLKGHGNSVSSVAFSSDGKTLVSGSGSIIDSLTFSSDGKTLVSGSHDNTVRLWDAITGEAIGEPLRGHESPVNSVAFSPDGKTLVSGSTDNTVRLWNAMTGEAIGEPLRGHGNSVNSVAFSPDGKTLVSGSSDNTVRLWGLPSGEPIGKPIRGREGSVNSIAYSPDGKILVGESGGNTVWLWDAATGKPIGEPIRGREGSVSSIAFSPDGMTLVIGGYDSMVRLWDVTISTLASEPLIGHENSVNSVAFSPDGKTFVSGSHDNTLRLWDAMTGEPIGEPLRGHESPVNSVAFSPDGKTLVSGSGSTEMNITLDEMRVYDNTVRLWDAMTGEPIGEPLRGHESSVNSVAFSLDGKTLVSGSGSTLITLDEIRVYDNTVRLWDVMTGEPIGEPLRGHESSVNSVAFSPDGKTIVSGSHDNTVRLWNAMTGEAIGEPLRGHTDLVNSVAFSPDGRTLVSGGRAFFNRNSGTLWLWDMTTNDHIGKALTDDASISSLAFSPNGRLLVSGSAGGFLSLSESALQIWDTATGISIGKPLTANKNINSVAFSPDSSIVVSGSSDGTVRLWNISQEKLLQSTCNLMRWHSILTAPKTDVEKEAKRTCDRYVWSKEKSSP